MTCILVVDGVEIEGEIVALLQAGTNKNAAAFGAAANSLKLVVVA